MLVSILTFVAGFVVATIYDRRAMKAGKRLEKQQRELIYKLPSRVVAALEHDKRQKLTVPELNQLLREQTVDVTKDDVLAYKACPQCGSERIREIEKGVVDGDREGIDVMPVRVVKCDECGWQTDEFRAAGYGPDLV
jgi:hypothetical protein